MSQYTHLKLIDFTTQGLKNLPDTDLLRAYWVYTFVARPWLVNLGSKIGGWSVSNLAPARWAVEKTIFAQFCGGESVEECRPTMERLASANVHTILDYSVEGAETEASFAHTASEIAHTIREAARSSRIAFSVFKVTGLGRASVLEAASSDPAYGEHNAEARQIADRVDALCKLAYEQNVRLFVDAEETWLQPFIDRLALEAMKRYNREKAIIFNTYQQYLHDGLQRIKAQAQEVWASGAHLGAKLVRGAYMEKESVRAAGEGRLSPINIDKEATDTLYDEGARFCLDHIGRAAFCLGTHNQASCERILEGMGTIGLSNGDPRVWFAQLLGMSDNLSYPLAEAGYNVAKYVPYGPVSEVVPYLIRRAQENTTVAGQSGRELQLIEKEVQRRRLNRFAFFKP